MGWFIEFVNISHQQYQAHLDAKNEIKKQRKTEG